MNSLKKHWKNINLRSGPSTHDKKMIMINFLRLLMAHRLLMMFMIRLFMAHRLIMISGCRFFFSWLPFLFNFIIKWFIFIFIGNGAENPGVYMYEICPSWRLNSVWEFGIVRSWRRDHKPADVCTIWCAVSCEFVKQNRSWKNAVKKKHVKINSIMRSWAGYSR